VRHRCRSRWVASLDSGGGRARSGPLMHFLGCEAPLPADTSSRESSPQQPIDVLRMDSQEVSDLSRREKLRPLGHPRRLGPRVVCCHKREPSPETAPEHAAHVEKPRFDVLDVA
jgi:hypothetical protein